MTGLLTGSALGGGLSSIGKWFTPLVDGAKALITTAWPFVERFGQHLGQVWNGIVAGVKPVADAIGGLFKNASSDGTVKFFGDALTTLGGALSTVAGWLKPVGEAIAGVVGWFSHLPAPVKEAALALGIMKFAAGPLVGIFKSVRQSIIMATYGMGALGFAGRSVGASLAIVGTSIKTAFGGGIGLVLTAVVTGLAFFTSGSKDAAQATADFSDALDTNTGKLADNGVSAIAAKVKDAEAAYIAVGGAVGDYTLAVSGNAAAQQRVRDQFTKTELSAISGTDVWQKYSKAFSEIGISASDIATAYATGGDAVGNLQTKFRAGTDVLAKYGIGIQDTNNIFQQFGSTTEARGKDLSTFNGYVGQFAGQQKTAAGVAAAATTAQAKLNATITAGSGGVKDATTNTGDMTAANEAAMISASKTATAYDGMALAVMGAKVNAGDFFTLVASKTAGDPATVITPMSTAFDAFNTAVSAADTTTQMFMMTMDKLAGRDTSVEAAMSANAAAARGLGAAQRQTIQNLLDQKKAVADLATAQADLNKNSMVDKKDASGKTVTNKDGSAVQVYSDSAHATALAAITSAQLALADANDKVAGSQDTINQANTEYQKTAALRIVQVAEQTTRTGGFGKAVIAATTEMQKQRDAFIAQQPAADIASGAAAKLADKYGLIPKNVVTIISGDTKLAQAAAKYAQETASAVAKRKYELKLTAQNAAAVQMAKDLQKQADLAAQLRTLHLEGVDNASPKVQALKAQLSDLQKTAALPITLQVNAAGGIMRIAADGSFSTGSGAKGNAAGGHITGPGTGTSDSIPTWLSNGEFVVKADQTAKHLPLLHAINAGAKGFATGGLVGTSAGTANLSLNESGNIDPALAHIAGIIGNARKSADALNAAAAAQAAAMASAQSASGLLGNNHPDQFGWTAGDVANIVPYSFQGNPFPAGVARGTVPLWNSLLSELAPLIPGGIRPHENWGYENRDNVNSPGTKSFHSFGLALDVNAPENPNIPGSTGPRPPGPGVIPAGAAAIAAKHNMLWGGAWGDAMHFELHETPQQVNGVGAAGVGAAVSSALGGLFGGSGMERFRPLANAVFAAKGVPLGYVDTLIRQGEHESSGNVNAINLTDSNAQAGHPSQGLLQFIPSTFAQYADPGFNTNILDPESQFRAFINYINGRYGGMAAFTQHQAETGWGPYANGGLVRGPGTGRSDSVKARVSNGEFIVNAASTAKNLPLLHSINGYADGGLVGSLAALQGRTAATVGPELSQVTSALQSIAQAVSDARALANDKQGVAVSARDTLTGAKGKQQQDLIDYTAKLTEAQQILKSETAKTSARTKKLDLQRVADATAALSKVKAADKASVSKATREYTSALHSAQSYANAATQAERFQRSQQRAYQVQSAYAARVDYFTSKLGAATDKLSQMRADKASMASGIASTVSGFDGGITGHNDTRKTFATILRGQQYDQDQAQRFNLNISKLSKLGLNNNSLNQIASAGVDGGGATAAALAGATKAQIAQLNGVTGKITSIGNNVGNVVGSQFYDAGIHAGEGLVKGLTSQIGAIQKVMNDIATSVITTLTSKLKIKSPSQVMHGHGINITEGLNNGILSGQGKVSSSMAGLVQMPNIPAQNFIGGSSGAQSIDVQVFLDGQRIDDRIDVKVNGTVVALTHGIRVGGMQRK